MTAEKKPWFLVMRPEDANRPGSEWVREGAASRGKVVARPIAPEGWLVLLGFVLLLPLFNVAIWVGLFATGKLTLIGAIASSFVVTAALIFGLVVLIRGRTTRLPPAV